MDEHFSIDLNPVTHITTDAIGPPGQRVFYIQAHNDDQVVTLIIEKFQLQSLSNGVELFLAEVRQKFPALVEAAPKYNEEDMVITPPVEPLFRVSEFGLSYDAKQDMVALIAREDPFNPGSEEQTGQVVRFWCSRLQIRSMVHWGVEISSRGRPECPQCGQPMDPEGHFCARKNGHKS
ncbi:MAG: DUF3090 domain-containing protein [Anaerolineae bacterium]|nr:DUF3090 domain-containing protein [Anaerolineae bacterium]